jgi:hypothetical protein
VIPDRTMGELVEALVANPSMTVAIVAPSSAVARENFYRLKDLINAHQSLALDPEGPTAETYFTVARPAGQVQPTVQIYVVFGAVGAPVFDRIYLDQIYTGGSGATDADREADRQKTLFWLNHVMLLHLRSGGRVIQ